MLITDHLGPSKLIRIIAAYSSFIHPPSTASILASQLVFTLTVAMSFFDDIQDMSFDG